MRRTNTFLIATVLSWLPVHGQTQSPPANAILAVIYTNGLTTPRSRWEQKTRAEINGTSCTATKWTDVGIESSGKTYVLSYNVEVDITDLRDACLEGDVPEIDAKFALTFDETGNSKSID